MTQDQMTPDAAKAKRHAFALVAEINRDELAVRLMERAIGLKRPPRHITEDVTQILDAATATWPVKFGPFPFRDMADIALAYLNECVKAGQQPS